MREMQDPVAMNGEPEAVEIARARAVENGLAFAEPIAVVHRRGRFVQPDRFEIETNTGKRGTKARFTVEVATGKIVSEGSLAR